ncbi:MAG: hypothetical protein M9921_00830 [Fimbriimonadaceae bacterium]|nr:hypothetical protein [Chthonomonadaceae bacterium]MCO5295379.1 hypothetical protein [Fimbriimonadaceae bacterium]
MDRKTPLVIMIALLTVSVGAQESAKVSASGLVSRMLGRYSAASSMTGTIRFTQSAQRNSVTIETTLQYEKPSKLYIRQQLRSSEPMTWLVVSDGTQFSYNTPENLPGAANLPRLVEQVKQNDVTLDTRGIYKAAASSIGDRSAPLDIVIGDPDDLKGLTFQWATLEYRGQVLVGDERLDLIAGRWRPYGTAPAHGTYEMYLTPSGELRRYVVVETVGAGPENPTVIEVRSVWDVNLKIDGKVDPALFKVVRQPQ